MAFSGVGWSGDGGSFGLEFIDDINGDGDSTSPRSDPFAFGSHMMMALGY